MDLRIDHVAVTCADLSATRATFEALGLAPEYGGEHGDGTTHMAVLGFDDGTYLELIAPVPDADGEPGFWPAGIRNDAGPYAWAIEVADVPAHAKRVIDAGHPVEGPRGGSRERPDGTLVEWDMVFYGDDGDRPMLPFALADRTPRRYRVTPAGSVAGGPLRGVGEVLVAVADLDRATATFRDLYRLPTPLRADRAGATVASFPGVPLALVTDRDPEAGDPADERAKTAGGDGTDGGDGTGGGPTGPWVADRIAEHGDRPCGVLLETDDLAAAADRYPLSDPEDWPTGRVAWVEGGPGRWLGVVERAR